MNLKYALICGYSHKDPDTKQFYQIDVTFKCQSHRDTEFKVSRVYGNNFSFVVYTKYACINHQTPLVTQSLLQNNTNNECCNIWEILGIIILVVVIIILIPGCCMMACSSKEKAKAAALKSLSASLVIRTE